MAILIAATPGAAPAATSPAAPPVAKPARNEALRQELLEMARGDQESATENKAFDDKESGKKP